MRLRHPNPEDASAITTLHLATWRAAYSQLVPPGTFDRLDPAPHLERWERRCRKQPEDTLLCEADEGIMGFALLGEVRDDDLDPEYTVELYALYVAADRWRQGIARRLVDAARSEAKARGYKAMSLWTLKDNLRARNAYLAMGFDLDYEIEKDVKFLGLRLREVRYRCSIG
ncbi:MAG: GNAT family N-acetyltransferase [Planctomycetota bacterium]